MARHVRGGACPEKTDFLQLVSGSDACIVTSRIYWGIFVPCPPEILAVAVAVGVAAH